MQRSAVVASSFLTLVLIGCGSGSASSAFLTSLAQYRAYGDSITYGFTLNDPATQAYPALVAKDEVLSLANNAISGDQACDVATLQIFPAEDSPTLARHLRYTLLIGTNDAFFKGSGPYEAVFKLCHQAAISWLAVPAEYKVLAGAVGMTATGPGEIDTSNHWNSWTTKGQGATVSFAITTSRSGPLYAWPRIDDNNAGTYTYSLDGVILGTSSIQTTPSISTHGGGTNSLGFLRLPSVPAGKHVLTFTQKTAGSSGVSVVGIGTPTGPITDVLPKVLVGTIPFQLPNTDGCDALIGICQRYIQDIESDVNLLSGDGLSVVLFDTRKYMFGTPAEMNDFLHPNVLGQTELSHAVEASW